jgi:hypothetical protein
MSYTMNIDVNRKPYPTIINLNNNESSIELHNMNLHTQKEIIRLLISGLTIKECFIDPTGIGALMVEGLGDLCKIHRMSP